MMKISKLGFHEREYGWSTNNILWYIPSAIEKVASVAVVLVHTRYYVVTSNRQCTKQIIDRIIPQLRQWYLSASDDLQSGGWEIGCYFERNNTHHGLSKIFKKESQGTRGIRHCVSPMENDKCVKWIIELNFCGYSNPICHMDTRSKRALLQ
jgi:hypothetical protein